MKTVAIIDGGGRGAALVHAYSKSPEVGRILVIPGNDLMQLNSKVPVIVSPDVKTTDVSKIIAICKKEKVDLIDVAQDNAVEAGLTDALLEEGFTVFGPTKAAGEIEWSKAYSRKLATSLDLPQPEYEIFDSVDKGFVYLDSQPDQPWFVKASGLAFGKGALPAANNEEAKRRIEEVQKFGESGRIYLLEKWLKSDGEIAEEFSAFAISDGNTYQIIGYAQDHKRVFDGDKGENTGGMGVSTPPLVVDEDIKKQVNDIFAKTFEGLKKDGRVYKGILYLGGILIGKKVYIIEFNARWGDPEAEVIVPSLQNDYYQLALAAIKGNLSSVKLIIDNKARVAVAGAAKGYPDDISLVKGKEITGLEKAAGLPGVIIYGAGIKAESKEQRAEGEGTLSPKPLALSNMFVVGGGRVFYVVGEGKDVVEAREKAYTAMKLINIEGNNLHYRTDIGWRDLRRIIQ